MKSHALEQLLLLLDNDIKTAHIILSKLSALCVMMLYSGEDDNDTYDHNGYMYGIRLKPQQSTVVGYYNFGAWVIEMCDSTVVSIDR